MRLAGLSSVTWMLIILACIFCVGLLTLILSSLFSSLIVCVYFLVGDLTSDFLAAGLSLFNKALLPSAFIAIYITYGGAKLWYNGLPKTDKV